MPSMAFTLEEQARLLLDPPSRVRRDDAAGFTSCCGLVSRSVPLRTPPLDDARGPHYRGPWHLPEPDFHRLAALSLSLSYVTTTSLSSWRPSCWTHSSTAGSTAPADQPIIQVLQPCPIRALPAKGTLHATHNASARTRSAARRETRREPPVGRSPRRRHAPNGSAST
jgi:hypothetical protein